MKIETILFSFGNGSDKELIRNNLNPGNIYQVNHYTKNKKFISNDKEIAKKIYKKIK